MGGELGEDLGGDREGKMIRIYCMIIIMFNKNEEENELWIHFCYILSCFASFCAREVIVFLLLQTGTAV